MDIIGINVFDPALHGYEDLPPRLELLLSGDDQYQTSIKTAHGYLIENYGPFIQFTVDSEAEEKHDLGRFNTSKVMDEALFPVTVSEGAGMWLEYNLPVSRVQQLLRRHNNGIQGQPGEFRADDKKLRWRLEVDETYAQQGDVMYRLEVVGRSPCVRCWNGKKINWPGVQRVKVKPHRQVWLCSDHLTLENRQRAASRHAL